MNVSKVVLKDSDKKAVEVGLSLLLSFGVLNVQFYASNNPITFQ